MESTVKVGIGRTRSMAHLEVNLKRLRKAASLAVPVFVKGLVGKWDDCQTEDTGKPQEEVNLPIC